MGVLNLVKGFFLGGQKTNTTPVGTIEKEFGVQPVASRIMEDNINLWWSMYINEPPWKTCDVQPLGLPGAIGRELARHAMTEFSVTVSGGDRADYLNKQLQMVTSKFSNDLELGLCLGGIALKPYPEENRILVDTATTGFTPTHVDGTGKVIGGVFKTDPVKQGNDYYVRLEYHDFLPRDDGSMVYVIDNRAFHSSKEGSIGNAVALSEVNQWKDIQDHTEIEGLESPLFAYFKQPSANDIDIGSKMGVSVYSGATVGLIKQADQQWERIKWEYESGERKIFVDGVRGNASQFKDRLFEYGAFSADKDFFHEFNPELRDDPLYNGFQRTLQRIEFNVGLAYGTISDPQSVEKTATEIMAAKHRQYVTEDAIQKAFQNTVDELVYAMNAWCDLAQLAPNGEYEVNYNWGDGVLDDPETRRQDMALDMQRVSAGLMRDIDFIMKWDKVDEETAKAMLPSTQDMVTEQENEIE